MFAERKFSGSNLPTAWEDYAARSYTLNPPSVPPAEIQTRPCSSSRIQVVGSQSGPTNSSTTSTVHDNESESEDLEVGEGETSMTAR